MLRNYLVKFEEWLEGIDLTREHPRKCKGKSIDKARERKKSKSPMDSRSKKQKREEQGWRERGKKHLNLQKINKGENKKSLEESKC